MSFQGSDEDPATCVSCGPAWTDDDGRLLCADCTGDARWTGDEVTAAIEALERKLSSRLAIQDARVDAFFDGMERVLGAAGVLVSSPLRVIEGGGKPGRGPSRRPDLKVIRSSR
jgi:hypothetical protein